ncbi:hypothetical protein [Staphylococcus phage vB_StaM_SA1]|nr:hypothetical protein [Staphylococcus phage vB_StaM_SA1]
MRKRKRIDDLIDNNLKLPLSSVYDCIDDFVYKLVKGINKKEPVKVNSDYLIESDDIIYEDTKNFLESIIVLLEQDEGYIIDRKDLKLSRDIYYSLTFEQIIEKIKLEYLTRNNYLIITYTHNGKENNDGIIGYVKLETKIVDNLGSKK